MPETWQLSTDQLRAALPKLRAGDRVLLSGTIYTCLLYTSGGGAPGNLGKQIAARQLLIIGIDLSHVSSSYIDLQSHAVF